ncbi:MAG TPA: maleylpyruvate isomerase family mycothiol-dependent enzyme, partial [Candidatus Dormibacteraeota bacterium]|nr:maleylpyruvate isomerase family mycothiol-dependent enzyme [Candidatus Dormibacteraeota bacterium]
MDVPAFVTAIRREADRLVDIASATAPGAEVPMCPDWQVRDVLRHLGGVHRWARATVVEARTGPMDTEEQAAIMRAPDADADLCGWVRDGAEALASALEGAPADLVCFTFLPAPSARAFWARRQAHETGIHRRDVEAAAGDVTPYVAEVAADGIDELLCGFASRRGGRLRSDIPSRLAVEATDTAGSW